MRRVASQPFFSKKKKGFLIAHRAFLLGKRMKMLDVVWMLYGCCMMLYDVVCRQPPPAPPPSPLRSGRGMARWAH